MVSDRNYELFNNLVNEFKTLSIQLIYQKDMRGMAGAVLSIKDYIKDESILIIGPSDIFEETLISDFMSFLKKDPEAILSGINVQNYFPGGYLTIDNGKVVSIVEKPSKEKMKEGIVRLVFDYFKNTEKFISILEEEKGKSDDIYEKGILKLVQKGVEITFLPYSGFWGHLKYPWHVLNLNHFFLSKITTSRIKAQEIAKTAKIIGNVIVEEGVRILDNAIIVGPCYIGRNTIIGNHTLVRESIIGDNCVVGFGSEVARSILANGCYLHTNYIGDSVLDESVFLGARATTANFRLDEGSIYSSVGSLREDTGKVKLGSIIGKRTKIGVHTAIMPGIKIGADSHISSGIVVASDVPDNMFLKQESNYKLVPNTAVNSQIKKKGK